MKKCKNCESPIDINSNGKYCSKECQFELTEQRNSYDYQYERGVKRKIHFIDKQGGCCQRCGYNKNISALDFHHLNPETKEFQLDTRKLSNSSMKILNEEFSKCVLICKNCHQEIHHPDMMLEDLRRKFPIQNEEIDKRLLKEIEEKKCIDCGKKTTFYSTRCVECNALFKRKSERPPYEVLIKEKDEHGLSWCGRKYGVTHTTIKRWIKVPYNNP